MVFIVILVYERLHSDSIVFARLDSKSEALMKTTSHHLAVCAVNKLFIYTL